MLTERGTLVGIALTIVATTVVFLAALAFGAVRRWRGGTAGRGFGRLLTFLAGLMFGSMILIDGGPMAMIPIVVITLGIAVVSWRRGRLTDAGLIVAGAAVPWTGLWSVYAWAMLTGLNDFDAPAVWNGVAVGAVPLAIGLGIAALRDRQPPAPRQDSHGWQPGARTIGTLSAAIRGSSVGAFGLQEVAAVVAIVVVQLSGALALVLLRVDATVAWIVTSVLGAIAGAEAYIRAMPAFNRKAFEAFSWLGDQELAQVRAQTGEGPPLTQKAADAWLDRHPRQPDIEWIRAEVLAIAGRYPEAREAAESMPDGTTFERVMRLGTLELVEWLEGRGGDLAALEAAVAELPPDSEDGLRAAVALAAARTRNRMLDGRTEPGDAALPLVEVRERLGHRADGQVGRALRHRILPIFLVLSLLFGAVQLALDALGILPAGF
jgi:hypothetical protein